jgi:hypothetical protein
VTTLSLLAIAIAKRQPGVQCTLQRMEGYLKADDAVKNVALLEGK